MKLKRIETLDQLTRDMDFFLEGYYKMVSKIKEPTTKEMFIKLLLRVIDNPDSGLLFLCVDEENNNLGYGCGFEDTPLFSDTRVFHVLGLYSNELKTRVADYLFTEGCKIVKDMGFDVVTAASGRMNGGAINFYTKRLGFTKHKILYRRDI